MNRRKAWNALGTGILSATLLATFLFLLIFLARMFYKGFAVLSPEFLFSAPRNAMTEGGIFPALMGTFLLTGLSILIALPLGILTAIWMNNYGKPTWLIRILRIAINTLAGTPSIITGSCQPRPIRVKHHHIDIRQMPF